MCCNFGSGRWLAETIVKQTTRPPIFKWRQTAPELILYAVRWYLRYSLSLRDVEELFAERGLDADHTTIWRWVQRYGPALEQRLRHQLKPTNKSRRVDETNTRVNGHWCYLYRAIDSTGATIDFLLSALRDAVVVKRLFRQASSDPSRPQPRVINTDRASLYRSAIATMKAEGRNSAPGLPPSTSPIFEQHSGAGPSCDQTPRESQAGLSCLPRRAASACGLRGDTHDSQGTGAVGQPQ